MKQNNVHPVRDTQPIIDDISALVRKTSNLKRPDFQAKVLTLLAELEWSIQELDAKYADEFRDATRLQSENERMEVKLDDIMTTFDMVSTGFRDFSDLARTIAA